MEKLNRRTFLRNAAITAGSAVAISALPYAIRRALTVPAAVENGNIADVKHVVILAQENRSFDHYFGTLRGVRGFRDPRTIPNNSGNVFKQNYSGTWLGPWHANTKTMETITTLSAHDPDHQFPSCQWAWGQGKMTHWPTIKNPFSMAYFGRDDLPFQYALAEAFTICDAYHCALTGSTGPNRVALMSGSNYDPTIRKAGHNSTVYDSEVYNERMLVSGLMPSPGYKFLTKDRPFTWLTIPEVLESAGITWKFYQDPNDIWDGLFNPCLAFKTWQDASKNRMSPLYRNGMTLRTIADLASDVKNGSLPQVSWILPGKAQSEHPGGGGSTNQAADFVATILDALTANPDVWSKTVFFITFDESDGFFDHVPPPAIPSIDASGNIMGKSTVSTIGEYFQDTTSRSYLNPDDTISGPVRPWGLGFRVPMYVVSPWSKGGYVNSQVFSHQSVGMFLEKRFGVAIPAISPWHRTVCGDLTSTLDFTTPNMETPTMPDMSHYVTLDAQQAPLPAAAPPISPEPLYQEPGIRLSRALPYELHTSSLIAQSATVTLEFSNTGSAGAVFHVYDKLHLDRIPKRYTVEAQKIVNDTWDTNEDSGDYDLWVSAPNGFVRAFCGNTIRDVDADIRIHYSVNTEEIYIEIFNRSNVAINAKIEDMSYRTGGPWALPVEAGHRAQLAFRLSSSKNWYDFNVHLGSNSTWARRFAGRMETGKDGISDPTIGTLPQH
ncbi:phosphocholine-specific phospholipase C [Burkholderia sp. Bp9015]|uniref:phosphocholine-specific phospholipase C n=1 Tax=Burkholderia sp. Bp9015 TaxID=2184563 RepID=UPI000F5B7506|nr:phospholipase C, phosphocholine-specific [Burkholderia sp. Bp9015]RQR67953.1 phospholipase C, phosphocholine-specific [Burkholderia sp. Bp9015]